MAVVLQVDAVDYSCSALCDLSVTRGRQHPAESYEPGTLSVTLIDDAAAAVQKDSEVFAYIDAPASTPLWDTSTGTWDAATGTWNDAVVRIVLFHGFVTDLSAGWLGTPEQTLAMVKVLAVDPLGRLANFMVGDAPWPSETCAARASRIAALVGLAPLSILGTGPVLLARDVDRQPALDLLDGCAADGSEWGGIYFDPATGTYTWTLGGERNTTTPAVTIDSCNILGDFSVAQVVTDICNDVTVQYGSPQAEVRSQESTAVLLGNYRHANITTNIAAAVDAQDRADTHVLRYSSPAWKVDSITVPSAVLDPDTEHSFAETLLKLPLGSRIAFTGMPAPGDPSPSGYMEGWQFDMHGSPDIWSVGLHVSPVEWSGPLITWDGAPYATWDAAPAGVTWQDVVGA